MLPQLDGPSVSRRQLEHTLARHPMLTGLLVSDDRRTAGIVVELAASGGTPRGSKSQDEHIGYRHVWPVV